MQENYGSQKKDFIHFTGDKIEYSSVEYLRESLESNKYMTLVFDDALGAVRLPFCSTMLIRGDSWARHLIYSDAHRRLLKSKEFADSIKPFTRWSINKMLDGFEGTVDVDKISLYRPIYEKLFSVHAPIEYDAVHKFLNPKKDETILEIGCATGNLSHLLANDVREVTGVDGSKPYIKYARKKAKKLGLKNCRFINAVYPCNLGKYDYTIAFNMHFGTEEFKNHLFPSKEVLIGGFIGNARAEQIEDGWNKVRKTIDNFEKNYEIQVKQENLEELGEFMSFALLHMKRRN